MQIIKRGFGLNRGNTVKSFVSILITWHVLCISGTLVSLMMNEMLSVHSVDLDLQMVIQISLFVKQVLLL